MQSSDTSQQSHWEKEKKTQQNVEPTKGIHHLQICSRTKWACVTVCVFSSANTENTRVSNRRATRSWRGNFSLFSASLYKSSPLLPSLPPSSHPHSSPLLALSSPHLPLSPPYRLSLCNRRLAHRSPRVLIWTFHNPAACIFFSRFDNAGEFTNPLCSADG